MDEIRALNEREPISYKLPIKPLNPFLDAIGFLRLGDRLQNVPISYDEKNPKV